MKTIGLVGGLSWESTLVYYRYLNAMVRERRGGLASARCVLYSVNFAEIHAFVERQDSAGVQRCLIDAAQAVVRAGAECVLLCANTMHRYAESVADAVSVPLLHIVDATARTIQQQGYSTVGLLGTRLTMEGPFYAERMHKRHGISVITPANATDRQEVNRVIYEELCRGQCLESSRATYIALIRELQARGAQAVILGCTEIPLLISSDASPLPAINTTRCHAEAAIAWALADDEAARSSKN
jgi:aspartate racemase